MKGAWNMKPWKWKIWAVAILPAITATAQDVDLYNNITSPNSGYVMNFSNGQEIGDQIFLANYTTYPYLSDLNSFLIEYYSPNASFSGTVTADVRFYLNDSLTLFNGYPLPSTLFYDSGPFDIPTPQSAVGSDSAVLSFSPADLFLNGLVNLNPSMPMPSTFTVSMEFQGLEDSDQAGLTLGTAPTVGYNYGDYWLNNGGTWELLDNAVPVQFKIEVDVPEPNTLYLAAVGAALLAGFARRRRQ
jgi:hypothetical protein